MRLGLLVDEPAPEAPVASGGPAPRLRRCGPRRTQCADAALQTDPVQPPNVLAPLQLVPRSSLGAVAAARRGCCWSRRRRRLICSARTAARGLLRADIARRNASVITDALSMRRVVLLAAVTTIRVAVQDG